MTDTDEASTSLVTDNQILTALEEGLALIRERDSWTSYAPARDVLGNSVSPFDPRATCWCAVGALHRVTDKRRAWNPLYERARMALVAASIDIDPDHSGMTYVNDKLGHPFVIRMYEDAAAEVRQRIAAATPPKATRRRVAKKVAPRATVRRKTGDG